VKQNKKRMQSLRKKQKSRGNLNGRLVEEPHVGGCLAWLLVHQDQLRVDGPESVNHHFAFHTLDGIDHHSHSPSVQLLETLQRRKCSVFLDEKIKERERMKYRTCCVLISMPDNQHPKPG
jgi:hypothetical protein